MCAAAVCARSSCGSNPGVVIRVRPRVGSPVLWPYFSPERHSRRQLVGHVGRCEKLPRALLKVDPTQSPRRRMEILSLPSSPEAAAGAFDAIERSALDRKSVVEGKSVGLGG